MFPNRVARNRVQPNGRLIEEEHPRSMQRGLGDFQPTKIEREHKILAIVRQEAAAKRTKLGAEKARAVAEDTVAAAITRIAFHIAGEFGEKRFLAKLEVLIKDRPLDIVNLKLEVPTLKGAMEKTPSHMTFEVTSTDQQDITVFLTDVRGLVRDNQLVLVNETKL